MKDEDAPPSYSEAISQGRSNIIPQDNNERPPVQPPRPYQNSSTANGSYTMAPSSVPTYGYQSQQRPPQQYNQEPPQHPSYHQNPQVQYAPHASNSSSTPSSQSYSLPWNYPRGYWCQKCHNTGRKLKNGKSCQYCWERFAPRNTPGQVHITPPLGFNSLFKFGGFPFGPSYTQNTIPPTVPGQLPPRFVKPGDPSMGGMLCGKCRGSGLVTFFLDEELCSVCNGVGRVFV